MRKPAGDFRRAAWRGRPGGDPVRDEVLNGVYLGNDSPETCDGCGPHIRAIWVVWPGSGDRPLTFCGEHHRRYLASL